MKKLIFILALSVVAMSCKKDDAGSATSITNVSSTYKVMVVEFTATWCSPCGAFGYPNWEAAHNNHPYKTTGISLHRADDISDANSPAQVALETYWGFSGSPSGAVNNGSAFYPTTVDNTVTSTLSGKIANAGVGISKTLSGNTLTINTKSVFFNNVTGDVYLAVYVVENDIMNIQASQTGVVKHNHVFRGSANGTFGESIASSPTKGKIVDGTYTFTVPSDVINSANLHVVAVLWTMAGGVPVTYINSNMD